MKLHRSAAPIDNLERLHERLLAGWSTRPSTELARQLARSYFEQIVRNFACYQKYGLDSDLREEIEELDVLVAARSFKRDFRASDKTLMSSALG